MRYVCSHCGTVVESEETPAKCPNCLRKHGLIQEEESGSDSGKSRFVRAKEMGTQGRRRSWKGAAVAAAFLLAAGIGLWWWHGHHRTRRTAAPATHKIGKQSPASLSAAMVQAGAPRLPIPFQQNKSIEDWASKHLEGTDPSTKAHSLQKALEGLLDDKTCKRPGIRMTPKTLLTPQAILSHSGPALPCHSFALAALGLAAARASGLEATIVELYAAAKPDGSTAAPLDPTGSQGHFGVAILAKGSPKDKPLAIIDPLSPKQSQTGSYQLLDDLTALAAYLNLKAQALAPSDPPTARMLADAASKLGPRSPSVQCGVGTVLIALGGLSEGTDAVLKAISLKNDASRQFCLASAKLAARDVAGAMSALKAAVKKSEAYAFAYVLQARIMLAMGQPSKAAEFLDRAEQHRPGMRSTKVLRAMLAAVQGRIAAATNQLEELLKEQPDDPDAFGALWQIYVSTGMTDQAAKLAKTFASHMPSQQAAQFLARMQEQRKAIAKLQQAAAGGQKSPNGPTGETTTGQPGQPGQVPPIQAPGQGPLDAPPPNMDFKLKAPTDVTSRTHKGPKLDLNL